MNPKWTILQMNWAKVTSSCVTLIFGWNWSAKAKGIESESNPFTNAADFDDAQDGVIDEDADAGVAQSRGVCLNYKQKPC